MSMPELMGSVEALEAVDGAGARLADTNQQTLACGTLYLADDVRDQARYGRLLRIRKLPELMGRKEAAEHLGVKGPNLHKTAGLDAVPQQMTQHGAIYLADGIRELKRQRDTPRPERVCRQHGDTDMRVSQVTGKRWCAVCSRERKRRLLGDSVRRQEYNRRRREQYRERQAEQRR